MLFLDKVQFAIHCMSKQQVSYTYYGLYSASLFDFILRRVLVWNLFTRTHHYNTFSVRKNFYLDPRGNSVVSRTWIPRYRRTVIGWDKHCRGRVIDSREWNELPYKRNIQRLRHYFLIITSLNYLLFLLLLFLFQMFVFKSTLDWLFMYVLNIVFCASILIFLVALSWRDFPRSLLHMTTIVLKIFSNMLVNELFF